MIDLTYTIIFKRSLNIPKVYSTVLIIIFTTVTVVTFRYLL